MSYSQDAKQLEKALKREAKQDEKAVTHAAKTLHSVEKDEGKAEKAAVKAESAREKAIKQEHKTAKALNEASHRHDVALTDQKKADQDLQMTHQQAQNLEQEVARKRAEFDAAQQKRQAGEIARERRLSEVRSAGEGASGAAGPA